MATAIPQSGSAATPPTAPAPKEPEAPSPDADPKPGHLKAPPAKPPPAKPKRTPKAAKPKAVRPIVAKVAITVATIPAGAEVRQGGQFLGLTPVTLQRPKSAKAEAFQLSKKGYRPAKALAVMSEDRRITKRLQKEGGP